MILDLDNLSISHLKFLNKISIEIHNEFNSLTEKILNSTSKKVVDLVSNLVSRHPYQSDLFKICYTLEFIMRISSESKVSVIKTKDYGIYHALIRIPNFKYNIKFTGAPLSKINLKFFVKPFLYVVSNLLFIKRMFLSRNITRRREITSKKSIILIDTFLLQNSINKKKFIDRYYSGILNYLNKEQRKKIFFAPLILGNYSKKDIENIVQNSDENLIFSADFLRFTDYFKIFKELFQQKVKKNNKFYFSGFDITKVIKCNLKREKFNTSTFQGLMNYFFIKRIKEENIKVDLFIDWNENQPVDKGLIRGIHDYYPGVKVKGYRGFIIFMDYNLYLMPTKYEVENGVIPDEIVLISKPLTETVKRFYSKINVTTGPAFRYMDLYSQTSNISKEENRVLVALPIGLNDAVEIIKLLKKSKKIIDLDKYCIIIRPHPSTSQEKLLNAAKDFWMDNFTFSESGFKEEVLKAKVFISNTSSAIMEALSFGTPVIVVGSMTGITQNPIPETVDKSMWKLVYDEKEMAEAIESFMNISDIEKLKEKGKEIRDEYFMRVTRDNVEEFINTK